MVSPLPRLRLRVKRPQSSPRNEYLVFHEDQITTNSVFYQDCFWVEFLQDPFPLCRFGQAVLRRFLVSQSTQDKGRGTWRCSDRWEVTHCCRDVLHRLLALRR